MVLLSLLQDLLFGRLPYILKIEHFGPYCLDAHGEIKWHCLAGGQGTLKSNMALNSKTEDG